MRTALPEFHPYVREWDAKSEIVTTPLAEGRMVWRRWGAGPPVVLVHGGSGSWTHWIRTIPVLSQHYTVWAVDQPGHGDSDPYSADEVKLLPGEEMDILETIKPHWQPQPPPMPAIGRHMARAVETIIPEGKFKLVGFSFGGMVSSNIAGRIPHRVEKIILCGAVGVTSKNSGREKLLNWRLADTPEKLDEVQRQNLLLQMLHNPASVDDIALNLQIINTARTQARKPRRSRSTLDMLRKAHSESGMRIAGIWGEFDAISAHDLDNIPGTLRAIDPKLDFHVIKGAGHWVAYEAADEYNRTLLEFLKT